MLQDRTPQDVYGRLCPVDREEIASQCFQEGRFLQDGSIDCPGHDWGLEKRQSCATEYLCEAFAAFLLVPNDLGRPEVDEAAIWNVETWVVRFRRALAGIASQDGSFALGMESTLTT